MLYVGFIHKDPDSDYGISFPDIPGCISVGDTIDEAVAMGTEALGGHIKWMEADGDDVPAPRSMQEILDDPALADDREGATLVLVPLVRDLGSTTRINVSLDLGLLHAMDSAARRRKQTRSAFIASAVRKQLIG